MQRKTDVILQRITTKNDWEINANLNLETTKSKNCSSFRTVQNTVIIFKTKDTLKALSDVKY